MQNFVKPRPAIVHDSIYLSNFDSDILIKAAQEINRKYLRQGFDRSLLQKAVDELDRLGNDQWTSQRLCSSDLQAYLQRGVAKACPHLRITNFRAAHDRIRIERKALVTHMDRDTCTNELRRSGVFLVHLYMSLSEAPCTSPRSESMRA